MNEEILKNAKFYLFQYAEKLADNIASATSNIKYNQNIMNSWSEMQKNDWREVYQEKISDSKMRIERWQTSLDKIDECVKYLDSLVK